MSSRRCWPLAEVEEGGTQQGRLREVEAGLETGGLGFQREGLLGGGSGGEVHLEQVEGRSLGAGVLLEPGVLMPLEAQAEGIVVGEQVLEGLLQQRGLQRLTRGQEDGLVEVVGVGRIVRQQVLLHGRERHGAGDGTLLCQRLGGGLRPPGRARATVWCWKSWRVASTSPAWRARATTWMLMMESPPSWKKLSWMPTWGGRAPGPRCRRGAARCRCEARRRRTCAPRSGRGREQEGPCGRPCRWS